MATIEGTVGLVTPRYAPAIGGVERVVEMLARELTRRNVNVEVITTDPTGELPSVEERDGVLVRRFPTLGNDGVYFLSPGLGLWLLRHAARFALLHAHSYHTPIAFAAGLASARTGRPLVVTPHYHGTGHSSFRRALHVPYRPFGRWLMHGAAAVVCVSAAEQRLLHRHFGPQLPTVVFPNGVEVEELAAGRSWAKPRNGMRVLGVGRLDSYKQVDRLITVVPLLPPDAVVTLVGDGPARSRIEYLVDLLRAGDQVRFVGSVPRDELIAHYRTADVFVSLSRQESFGLAVLEAAVAGLPVVASDIPAHREVAGYLPAGRVIFVGPDCSPLQLARAIEDAARLGRSVNVDSWPLPTWNDNANATLACYAAALRGAPMGGRVHLAGRRDDPDCWERSAAATDVPARAAADGSR